MALATFKIGRQEFVVVPKKRYEQLTRLEQDERDAEIARRGQKAILGGKLKTVPLELARKKWGV